jgi:hypothetical protein
MNESKNLKTCSNLLCDCYICTTCLERFVEICFKEQTIPRCMAPHCNSLYLRKDNPTSMYDLALFRGLLKDPTLEEQAKVKSNKQKMFQQIVEERRKNLADAFPLSIQKAVNIMYSSDLKRIAKSNQESIDEQSRKLQSKRCFRLFCLGVMTLDGQWSCSTCDTKFCNNCENRYEGANHKCKQEELASVEWKKALPHCPKCNQAIEKKDGCDYMTCAVCQQNFCYSTGEVSQAGNHGKSIPVSVLNESFQRLWNLFPSVEHRTDKQKRLANELKQIEKSISDEKINMTKPDWEWKASDISMLSKWISTSAETITQEERVAKMVALRVEKFEERRQFVRNLLRKVKYIEDEFVT